MKELTQALLNTCAVSANAEQRLGEIFSGGSSSGKFLELEATSDFDNGVMIQLPISYNELMDLIKDGYYVYFKHPYVYNNYTCYFLQSYIDEMGWKISITNDESPIHFGDSTEAFIEYENPDPNEPLIMSSAG